ncbi:hypothetical protein P154DRAFT_519085 [Amniculicola lignicola CBS 123094]|uniref:Regulator of phospholipase D SRF1 n=1 Tax=Amniculicola lignicola CBS 123094 TaxID=1392246 RepID=A0A6A5WWR0_9PLEO|nr:hypothetical protein P154DRAFT_519085 [Amniculicola lignicola CBS 123094]
MTSRPMVDQSNGILQSSRGLLLPSPLPPPSASPSSSAPRPSSGVSAVSSNHDRHADADHRNNSPATRKSHSQSVSSNPRTLASSKGSTAAENRDRQRAVRTLPPWVQSAEEDEHVDATSLLLPRTPTSVRPPSHNYMPTPKANAVAGRHFDYAREATPVTATQTINEAASKWQQFAKSSKYDGPQPPGSRGQVVDDDWMKENMPDLETPWHPIDEHKEEVEVGLWLLNANRRRRTMKRMHRNLMNHPMVPLVVRLTVFTFSALALGLAGSIFHRSDTAGCQNNSSTWLALIVDVIAIVYLTYVTYDEYTSKPLGLRSHTAKMTLIFLDLLFIVFDSANLSLAFQALTDERWACRDNDDPDRWVNLCLYSQDICTRQKALTATLLIALVAWLMTFAISTMRLIERVAR